MFQKLTPEQTESVKQIKSRYGPKTANKFRAHLMHGLSHDEALNRSTSQIKSTSPIKDIMSPVEREQKRDTYADGTRKK